MSCECIQVGQSLLLEIIFKIAAVGEGKMVVFKPLIVQGGQGNRGPLRVWVGRNSARLAGRVGRRFISYSIHSHVQGQEVNVKEGKIVPVLTFHSVHELGDELERGWGPDVVRVNFWELYVFSC